MMDDEYCVQEYSDDEEDSGSSSSEDEFQEYIRRECGIVEIKDDFEDEIDQAMEAHMEKLDRQRSSSNKNSENMDSQPSSSGTVATVDRSSDAKTNDELFYDPDMDDDDQKWIDDKRRAYIFPNSRPSGSGVKPLPNSDAVLNCPACLCLLCLDCQRHEIYKNQYRAMFVSNCKVISEETLIYPIKKQKRKKTNENATDIYNPVRCTRCNTEVAVYDKDEVYHFFNVIASYA